MPMRRILLLVGLTVISAVLCMTVLAQDACEIQLEGPAMVEAAGQRNYDQAINYARRIVDAAKTKEEMSPDELYYLGMAHRYLMVQAMDRAIAAGLPGEKKQEAMKIVQSVMSPAVEDVRIVSHGEQIDLADYTVPGQTVIFDFYSKYCGPCMQIGPYVERVAQQRDDVVVVKVDINRPNVQGIDWQSPVAQQYNLRSIPHFKIYGPEGTMVAEGDQARQMVIQWIQQLEG